jgi:hypothetical protein
MEEKAVLVSRRKTCTPFYSYVSASGSCQARSHIHERNLLETHAHNRNPGREGKNMEESQQHVKIGTRKNAAASIGVKQVPREPGRDTSSQPASEAALWIYLGRPAESMAPAESLEGTST